MKITAETIITLFSIACLLVPLFFPHKESDEFPLMAPKPSELLSRNKTLIISATLETNIVIEKNIVHRELEVAAYEIDGELKISKPGEIIIDCFNWNYYRNWFFGIPVISNK